MGVQFVLKIFVMRRSWGLPGNGRGRFGEPYSLPITIPAFGGFETEDLMATATLTSSSVQEAEMKSRFAAILV
jgi:hypothetical protein